MESREEPDSVASSVDLLKDNEENVDREGHTDDRSSEVFGIVSEEFHSLSDRDKCNQEESKRDRCDPLEGKDLDCLL